MRLSKERTNENAELSSPEGLSIRQNMLWNGIGATVYQGCQWLTTIVVVILSATYENSGALAFAMASGNVFTALAVFNAHTYQLSDTENAYSSTDYITFRLVTVFFAYVVCVAYSAAISPSLDTTIALVLYLLFKADESFVNVMYGIDQKGSRMDYMGISQGIRGILVIVLFSAALALTDSLAIAIVAMLIPCVLVTFFYDIPHASRLALINLGFDKDKMASLFRACFPLAISVLLYSAVAAFARQSFGVEYGEEALGIYAAIATPCVIVQVFTHYLYAPYLVPLAESFDRGNRSEFSRLLLRAVGFLAAIIVIFLFGMGFFGPSLVVLLYGESIESYAWMVLPAAIAASAMAFEYFVLDALIVVKRRISPLVMNAVALTLCVLITRPCVDEWYMNGINISLAVSLGVAAVYGAIMLIRAALKSDVRA